MGKMSGKMSKEYGKKYQLFLSGKISREEWINYTDIVLNHLLQENRGIFERLKNR
jgi:hypothetical protein